MTPIPPLVASPTVAERDLGRLRGALISGAIETELAPTLEVLMVMRFAPIDPANYAVLLTQAREADGGHIARPAQGTR